MPLAPPVDALLVALPPLPLPRGGEAEGPATEPPSSSGSKVQPDPGGCEMAGTGNSRGAPTEEPASESSATGLLQATPAAPVPAKPAAAKSLPVAAVGALAVPAEASGTSAAPLPAQMNVAPDMKENSEPEEQKLPTAAATAGLGFGEAGLRSASVSQTGAAGDSVRATISFVPPMIDSPAPVEKAAHVLPTDPTAKVLALMASAVVRLRQTGADDFEVAIQPDPDTEICLRVSLQGPGVEIQAELRRGDGAALAARWPELQERLAQQGIKLAALAADAAHAGSSGQNSEFHSRRHPAEPEGTGAGVSSATTTTTTVAATRASANSVGPTGGWETWA